MDDILKHSFETFFGITPHGFQVEAAKHLLGGHNVLLQAPTGSGKTYGAVFPFVYARQRGIPFADRLIYALPVRTLAVDLYERMKEKLAKAALETTLPELQVKIQTGAMQDDSLFQADVIFTTIDQLLSAYIGVPVSLPRKTANLPAGAILGAYVVFDEFHLLEPGRALATALDLADRLSQYTRLLLMSATVPDRSLEEIAHRSRADIVRVTPEQVQQIKSQRNKRRHFVWRDRPLAAQDILDAHKDRSIVVVNRVERAQQLFKDVVALAQERGVKDTVLLLHSRFLAEDRKEIEVQTIEHFKNPRDGGTGKAILIATQVIEVGLDISADVMHTELAPANAIFQRAGRCARYADEEGTVYVYALPLNERGNPAYGPYLDEDKPLVDETGKQIAARSGQILGFTDEQRIVDSVHSETELKRLSQASPQQRQDDVAQAMRTGAAEYIRRLIREVDSVNVLIHDRPETLRMDRRPQTFSVNRVVMETVLQDLDFDGEDAGSVRVLKFGAHGQDEAPDLEWSDITKRQEAKGAIYLSVTPTHAHYDATIGLLLGRQPQPTTFRSRETSPEHDPAFDPYSYVRETYEQHVRLVIQQHDLQEPACRVATARLAATFGLNGEELERLSRLVAALHDVGKLAEGWQRAIWRWQEKAHRERRSPAVFLAHSEYDSTDRRQRELMREGGFKKPPHAVEGAFATVPLLANAVKATGISDDCAEMVTFALASAIARHHSAFSENMENFTLSPAARAEVLRVAGLPPDGREVWDQPPPGDRLLFAKQLLDPQKGGDAFLLYWYVVRRLRLADQKATSMAGEHV